MQMYIDLHRQRPLRIWQGRKRRTSADGMVLTQLRPRRCSSAPTLNGISVGLPSYVVLARQ